MIVLRITSGLGNQMFQYAFYTLLKKQYPDTEILCDVSWFNSFHEHHGYELERIFGNVEGSNFEIKKASAFQITKLSGMIPNMFTNGFSDCFEKIRRYPNRLLKNNLLRARLPFIIDELEEQNTNINTIHDDLYDKVMNLDMVNDYYIKGFFISEKYYSKVLREVRKKLVFPEFTEDYNIAYEKSMKESDSVSIHVRRGDYLSDLYKDKFITLGREYYERAVNYITQEIKERCKEKNIEDKIKFFVFSDDADFVNREFGWLPNKTIVTENTGNNSYRDMQLMSICKYNIVANSTFSQWGALLNQNEDAIIVYPKVYMVGNDNEIKTTPSWVQI